ncbi:hypothetical protein B0A48_06387 [Cryoendolithus antarcticus]|uniref:Mediator of RNA polymerase II transcription subunit 8 n=1 Tax=Cryoendolithus antarcticus TaxID=1507870 RepID=A0A1V8TAR7_9PEZI|nr:hypothetical protein B0A48_06387 [Cryoendolithus antarcticus]
MGDLQKIMESSQELFKTAHAYPHAPFPGTTFEGNLILARLLRKRVEPDVEAWIKEHTEDAKVQQWYEYRGTGLQQDEQQRLWKHAAEENARVLEELVTKGAMDFDYTLAEYEEGVGKARTGLKRKLQKKLRNLAADEDEDDEDEEDSEDEDDEMEDVMPDAPVQPPPLNEVKGLIPGAYAMRLEDVLKFITTGVRPK